MSGLHLSPTVLFFLPSVLYDLPLMHARLSFLNPHILPPTLLYSLLLLLPVDISVSLLAVVVGFCGLALLVVSLFVFWKLCWPIWRSKAFSTNADNCPQGVQSEAPPVPPQVSQSISAYPETKTAIFMGRQPTQNHREDAEKRKVPEVKVNGRSSVKLLEAAMKISQTSPDIPAEVEQALRDRLSKQAKFQRQTTEPTSSSRCVKVTIVH